MTKLFDRIGHDEARTRIVHPDLAALPNAAQGQNLALVIVDRPSSPQPTGAEATRGQPPRGLGVTQAIRSAAGRGVRGAGRMGPSRPAGGGEGVGGPNAAPAAARSLLRIGGSQPADMRAWVETKGAIQFPSNAIVADTGIRSRERAKGLRSAWCAERTEPPRASAQAWVPCGTAPARWRCLGVGDRAGFASPHWTTSGLRA